MAQLPIAEGLFSGPAERLQLLASRCRHCGEVTFPRQSSCPRCTDSDAEEIRLSSRGTLWTFTVQRFPPPPPYAGPTEPGAFEPYGVGYVELPEGVRVEGRLTGSDPAKLRIGMEMEVVAEPFGRTAAGDERLTFAFRPLED